MPASPTAYFVSEYVENLNAPTKSGELNFQQNPEFLEATPEVQEAAKTDFEQFAMVLRVAFQKQEPALFREYFERLLATAQATFTPHGFFQSPLNDLKLFKREVVQLAGSRIKSRYTARLAFTVCVASVLLVLVGLIVQAAGSWTGLGFSTPNSDPVPQLTKTRTAMHGVLAWDAGFSFAHTGLLLAGAMWGLLFASMTRNIDPTFDTLVTPDADLMEPWVRLLFFGIPTFVIALMFQTQLVSISFGNTVSTSQINDNAIIAVLIGLLLGIAERALPAEVEQWSKKILPSSQNLA